jgi:chromosome segregation ATPase
MITGILSFSKYASDIVRTTIPALSSLNDFEIFLLGYSITWASIYLIGFLFNRFGTPDEPQQEQLEQTIHDQINEAKEEELSALRSETDTLTHAVQVQQGIIAKLTIEVENQKVNAEKLDQLQSSHESLTMEKNDILDDLFVTRLKLERQEIEISKLSDALKIKKFKIDQLSAENDKLHDMIKAHKETAADLNQKYEASVVMSDEFKKRCDRLSVQAGQDEEFKAQISQLTSTAENLRADLEIKNEQLKKREEESFGLCEQLDKMMSMISDKEKDVNCFESENSYLKETIRILEAEIRKHEILSVQNDQTINSLEAQIDKTEDLKDNLEKQWILDERNYTTKIQILKEAIMKRQPSNLDLPPFNDLSVDNDGDKLAIVKKAD